jgi:hypothetical protein
VLRLTILIGDPARRVIDHARDIAADVIVLGGPGRTEIASGVPSAFTMTVASEASSAVLLARTTGVHVVGHDGGMFPNTTLLARLAESAVMPASPLTVIQLTPGRVASAHALAAALARSRGSLLIALDHGEPRRLESNAAALPAAN